MSQTITRITAHTIANASATLRMVLDTNVWLDWLVFDDVGIAPIRNAVATGNACVFISPACEAELVRVLAYPLSRHTLNADAQATALAKCRAITLEVHDRGESHAIAALPRCTDPDDQMFLELARDCRADALVTKDRDLLALATRKVKPLPFRIIAPRQFARDFLRA